MDTKEEGPGQKFGKFTIFLLNLRLLSMFLVKSLVFTNMAILIDRNIFLFLQNI